MTDLSKDGGVIKKVVSEGTGPSPKKGNTVLVNYVGKLEDGTEFDASSGYPFSFPLGERKVIKGWDVAFKHMKKGEKAVLTIRADYAYGAEGSPPDIPPNATLTFEVELVDVKAVESNTREKSDLERLAKVRAERDAAVKKRADDAAAKQAAKPAPAPAPAPTPSSKGSKKK